MSNLLVELFDRIREFKDIQTTVIGEKTFSPQTLKWVNPDGKEGPASLNFHTLSGLVDFVLGNEPPKGDFEKNNDTPFIHVIDFNSVKIRGHVQPSNFNSRFCYAEASLRDESFKFGQWFDLERFIIAIQTQFIQTDETAKIMAHVGNLKNENIVNNTDDKLSQSINIKNGITTMSKVKVENPVSLKPYRTFRDIEQPESNCIIRFSTDKDNGMLIGIWEADGSEWKLEAIHRIKEFFWKNLPGISVYA